MRTPNNPDYEVSGGGTVYIVTPLNPAAQQNLESGVGSDAQWWAGGVAVEHRFISDLVDQLREEGWAIR
jgi:hypothetical protein